MIAQVTNQPITETDVKSAFYGPTPEQQDNSPRSQRLRRVKTAREMLFRKGYRADSSVFVTAALFLDDRDLEENESDRQEPQVCEVTGHYAVYLLADRTHRLSTPEEIERYRREQKAREELCAKIESKNPNNKNVHQTIHYNVMPTEDMVRAALIANPVEAPARSKRNGAGEQEK